MSIEHWIDEPMDRLLLNVEALTRVVKLQQDNREQESCKKPQDLTTCPES